MNGVQTYSCGCEHCINEQDPEVTTLFTVEGKVNGRNCRILIDCGANSNFLSKQWAQ